MSESIIESDSTKGENGTSSSAVAVAAAAAAAAAVDSCQTMSQMSSPIRATNTSDACKNGTTTDDQVNDIDCSSEAFADTDNDKALANALREENDQLKQSLHELRAQHHQLQSVSQQQEHLVDLQKKELELCANEKETLRRDYETSKKEKEQAVVRYAMLEKSIIDANNAKDLSARKLKDAQRELEGQANRIKAIIAERDKSYKEVREYIRENETLKYDLQTLETKMKWNQVKLKHELTIKNELEKRLNELTQQYNQLNGQRQTQIDSERKVEQEQGAQLIMLKHLADEKERNVMGLQKSIGDLRTEYTELHEKYELLVVESDAQKKENIELKANIESNENALQQQLQQIEELKCQLNEMQNRCQEQTDEIASLTATIDRLKYIEESFQDQSTEMAIVRSKEDDQLRLLKELTEKCVAVENKLILANSKASGLQLDNERLNKEYKLQQKLTHELDDELDKLKAKHNDEIKLFNRILNDEKSHSETLQNQLDNVTGDLEATKNKHTQTVKELNRELIALRTQQQTAAINGQSVDECDGDGSAGDNQPTNGVRYDMNKEPTKKALIERIVKLQRQLAKQTEKIEFLENHCIALFNELKAKTS